MFQALLWQELRSQARLMAGLFVVSGVSCLCIIVQAYCFAAIVNGAFLSGSPLVDLMPLFAAMLAAALGKAFTHRANEELGFRLAAAIKTSLRQQVLSRLFASGRSGL